MKWKGKKWKSKVPVPMPVVLEPILVKDRNEETGQKVGLLLFDDVSDGRNLGKNGDCGIENGRVVNLDKYLLVKRDFESEESRLRRTTFLRRTRQERMYLTSGIKQKNPDATVWELKTSVKGIAQWTTRGQCSIYEEGQKEVPVIAMTGFSRRGKSHKEVSDLVQEVMCSEKKEINYKQMSLRGANEQYKSGGHCTPVYSSRSYKMIYDGRRRVVVPKDIRKKYIENGLPLPMDRLYETEPWTCASESMLSRSMMNTWKKAKYVKYSPRLLPSTKEYEDFNERSVLVDVNSGRSVDITCKDPRDPDYNIERRLLSEGLLEKMAKFRSYRRRLKNLDYNIKESEEKIKNLARQTRCLEWFFLSSEELPVVDYKMKKRPLKISVESELKRLKELQVRLNLRDEKFELGIVGGEASDDLRRFLKNKYTESMKLVKVRFLPFLII